MLVEELNGRRPPLLGLKVHPIRLQAQVQNIIGRDDALGICICLPVSRPSCRVVFLARRVRWPRATNHNSVHSRYHW